MRPSLATSPMNCLDQSVLRISITPVFNSANNGTFSDANSSRFTDAAAFAAAVALQSSLHYTSLAH